MNKHHFRHARPDDCIQDHKATTDQRGPGSQTCSRIEAATYLGISTRSFDRIQKAHAIPYVQIGQRRRYLYSDLGNFLKACRSI